jgi:hypothetical protein
MIRMITTMTTMMSNRDTLPPVDEKKVDDKPNEKACNKEPHWVRPIACDPTNVPGEGCCLLTLVGQRDDLEDDKL